ncbi:MAG: SusC/RagA family TonB-linked outer membrane protein [Bacteroidales bacterium]|nr:SusC/RagA family TonB-linked outer membrane protein [Bacteroidales bacterium]
MLAVAGLLGTSLYAQNRAISGTVVDESGAPVIGAAVVVVGNSSIGAVTDVNGVFRLNVPAGANINVSCIGYADQTVAVGNQTNFRFVLAENTEFLDETVVIGYGVQKKSDLTGAVASVRAEELKNLSTTNAAAALQGKAAGVTVLTNGAPGSDADIRVRGYSSNGGNLSPLYIVDGLQVNNIKHLDPSSIESIEILKDAASAAIYGAEAGNGVVLVTTKSGREGSASVTYTSKAILQNYTKRPVMNREDFLKYKRLEVGDDEVEVNLKRFDYSHPLYEGGVIDQDWISGFMEPTWSQQHSLNFSGGNKNGHFFAALNYAYNNGVVKGDKDTYRRLSAQVNADYKLFKWLQVGSNNTIERHSTKSVSQQGYTSSFEQMLLMDPLTPVYWTDPSEFSIDVKTKYDAVMAGDTSIPPYRFLGEMVGDKYLWFANTKYSDMEGTALAKRDMSEGSNDNFNINGTLFANFMPIKGLTVTSRFGYRIWHNTSHSYTAPYYIGGRGSNDSYNISASANTGFYYQWENFANYLFNVGKHNFTVMGGMSYRETNDDNVSASGKATPAGDDPKQLLPSYEENFRYLSYVLDDASKDFSNSPSKTASLSYYGRLIWNYDNRYSFQANFRADAFDSSKLPAYNRWGYFPSFSAGWTVSNERFFKENVNTDVFNFLKFRASWGRNGNISVLGGYPYAATINKGTSAWYQYDVVDNGVEHGSAPSGLPNTNLRWEKSDQWDLGLDARMFNNRLTFGVDYFNKQTKDLLFNVSVPPELGVSSTMANGGNILNTGLEFDLGWKDQIGDFGYAINANFSTLHNEVISLAEGAAPSYRTDASSTNYQIRTAFEPGFPVWYLNGYIYEGMDDNGDPLYRNKAGEVVSQVSTDDMQYIGQGTPKYTYGINVNLFWKGFDLTVFGSGVGGNSILPVLHRTGYKNNLKWYLDNSRTDENPNGKLPHPSKVIGNYIFWSSTANLFKGDYFRIKQLQLGYTLPANITRKVAISNLRFYVSLDDFFTFTKYPGLDPETASTNNSTGAGLDWGSYPTMQKLILGVNLTF